MKVILKVPAYTVGIPDLKEGTIFEIDKGGGINTWAHSILKPKKYARYVLIDEWFEEYIPKEDNFTRLYERLKVDDGKDNH